MKLKLFIDIDNRKLCRSKSSDFPVNLATLFREDWIDLEITLCEASGTITSPLDVVDISSLAIKAAIGLPDVAPEAFQDTFTRDLTNNKFTGTLNINTTEMVAAFTAASGDTIDRYFEIEVEGTSNHFHTVLQEPITLKKDVIDNALVAPGNVTSGSAFATSFAATATDSTTIEWTKTGDYNYAHFKGMSGVSSLTASQFVKTNAAGDGFELAAGTTTTLALDDLTDADTTSAAPSTGDHLKWDGSNWVPDSSTIAHTHAADDLTDVDTTSAAPTSGQVLEWDGSNWVPATPTTAANLWETFTADSGTVAAANTTDVLIVQGGEGVDTAISGTTLTVSGEDASTTNKGIARFDSGAFTVSGGTVGLQSIAIVTGGTGATNAQDAFDNLAPTTAAGDMINHDGSDNVSLPIGTAGDTLRTNTAADAPEWQLNNPAGTTAPTVDEDTGDGYTVGSRWLDTTNDKEYVCLDATAAAAVWKETTGAGTGEANEYSFKTLSVSGQSDVVADTTTDTLTLAAGSNVTLTTDAGTDTVTIAASGGGGSMTFTLAGDTGTETIADTNTATIAGGTGLTTAVTATDTCTVTLDDTAVTPATYGDATHVAQIVIDQQGRISSASEVTISGGGGGSNDVELGFAVSSEKGNLAVMDGALTFRMPHAMTLTGVRANVNTAPTDATIIVDISESGTSILSTLLSIDAGEKTSTTAYSAAVISDSALADDSEMTIDITQIGSTIKGEGLKIWLIGTR